jgi:hypothetical protein
MLSHWHAELRKALAGGKLVVVFLPKVTEAYVYTGEKQFSGTGRNRVTTNIVRRLTSYDAVPNIQVTSKSGTEITVNGAIGFFASFWAEFRGHLPSYEVWIEGKFSDVLLQTKTGNRVVGAAIRQGTGAMLFLPLIRQGQSAARSTKTRSPGLKRLTPIQFGKKLVSALVALAESLASERTVSPPPSWVADPTFRLPEEAVLESRILAAQRRVEEAEAEKRQLELDLARAGSLRRLLYEQGTPLEEAILEALRLMGFTAAPFRDGDSEFDAVTSLDDRGEVFTEKCFTAAKRNGTALVRTPDLFEPVRYLKDQADKDYARRCREAVFAAKGEVVVFPPPPATGPGATSLIQAK